jgi:hypothetical protein
MTPRKLLLIATAAMAPIALAAQGKGVNPSDLLKPLSES